MQNTYHPRAVIRTIRFLAVCQLFTVLLAAASASAQTVVPVAPFRSIELRHGGQVILRYGPTPTVTLLKSSPDCVPFRIADKNRLVIDKHQGQCPRKSELEVEITTPDVTEILVTDGGRIQSRGSFPRQAEIKTAVRNGGTIDIRNILTEWVTASVEEGGGIFVNPQLVLSASVVSGGQITYWGDPTIESSVRHGGTVTKGTSAGADEPSSDEIFFKFLTFDLFP